MKSNLRRKLIIFISIIVLLLIILFGVLSLRISDVKITGNEKYSSKQLEKIIFNDNWMKNPLVFYIKTKFGMQKKIPFVTRYDVEMKSLTSVKITVYEKNVIGYIKYMDTNMYFDKDGIINESSSKTIDGVPKITGISFDYIILHKKLPVENEKLFVQIMNITQLLDKYKIKVDRIYVAKTLEMTLYIENVEVDLGKYSNLNEKIIDLNDMLPNLQGLSGTLDMTEYSDSKDGYTFKKK